MNKRLLVAMLLCAFAWTLALAYADTVPEGFARIHYQREDGDYQGWELHVWEDTTAQVTWTDGLEITGFSDYGAYWDVPLAEGARRVGFIVHKGDLKDPGPDMFLVVAEHGREIWLISGSSEIFTRRPLGPPEEGTARIHYARPDGDYQGWTLHVWEDTTDEVSWQDGLEIAGETDYGVYWTVNLREDARRVGFIVHRGDEKDPGPDMFLELAELGNEIWLISGSATLYSSRPDIRTTAGGDLSRSRAHWVDRDTLLWRVGTVLPGSSFELHASPTAALRLEDGELQGGEVYPLTLVEEGPGYEVLARFPHLRGYTALRLAADAPVAELLRGQLAVAYRNEAGTVLDASGVQLPGVLDDLYADAAYHEPLGIVWDEGAPTLRVWAPTAQEVSLHLFASSTAPEHDVFSLSRDDESGIWEVSGTPEWYGNYYLYEVTVYAPSTQRIETNLVTDPYSVSLAINSARSQLIDLRDPALKPADWDALVKPPLAHFADTSIYEVHMRDFSVFDSLVPAEHKGKYRAFTLGDSHGLRHLRALAEAGLTHLHLLPTFDIATIDEDPAARVTFDFETFAALPPDSTAQRELHYPLRDRDAFNWGYDPFHFNVPEGSYASDPDGPQRILEYREMVQAVNGLGLRFVKDVVYNHTNASGQSKKSVFDRIVPGYYHRLNADGLVETSTCCPNTASEHAMMRKFMIESVLLWARAYKVDGFRFDLMGHHMKADMLAVREALDGLTLEQDGVDGARIVIYGEGWNFGEVADNARGVNATQFNMAGSAIGTFNDRLRDAVRGGGPFDDTRAVIRNQGFVSGLYHSPNEANPFARPALSPQEARARLLNYADLIRIGLAGNLRDYRFVGHRGELISGFDVDYNGNAAGYALTPLDTLNYVEKHDNQTLYDLIAFKAPLDTPMETRVRMQTLGSSFVLLAQGIPFIHAGQDFLRSKSGERDSYNSGDWFNRLDFSLQSHAFGSGVPSNITNPADWTVFRAYLAEPSLVAGPEHLAAAAERFRTYLQLRYSSPLFRLQSSEEVQARLAFHHTGPEQIPGLIVMTLEDDAEGLEVLDPNVKALLVVFNATPERQTLTIPALEGRAWQLHPLLRAGSDEVVKTSTVYQASGRLSVPAYTAAVFMSR
jgi:pullulanase